MTRVILVICLSGLTYSPDVQIEDAQNAAVEAKSNRYTYRCFSLGGTKLCACCPIRICHYVPQIHLVNTHINI